MITGVAIVPGALLLLPDYVGRVDPIPALREAAQRCVDDAVAGAERIVVITSADADPRHSRRAAGERIALHLLGTHPERRPAKVAVLPHHATDGMVAQISAVLGSTDDPRSPRTALVVVADGSARRTEKAPGHLHPRAIDFDDALVTALRAVDLPALRALDASLADEVMAAGRAPLQVMAAAMGDHTAYTCAELVTDDSLGVLHVAARFARR
jgi:aromatic ring-opening dioxygenase LigB subunit